MGTVRMSDLLEQARKFDPSKAEPRTTSWAPLEEGFASDAQRRAAFASGYKEKGKKKDKKEDVDLDEAKATLSRFGGDRLKDSTMNLAKQRGLKVKDLGKDKIEISGNGKVVMALTLALQKKDVKINEDVEIQEDGHTDVASAVRQCKTIVEDATQMMAKLQGMNPEDSLPSWWSNKLAVASNNMNKMRDYLLVPATEALDKEDEPKVKEIIKKLKKASDAHAGQSKDLEKAVKEEAELDEKSEYGPDIKGEISQLQKMLKGLERGKKTPGKGFAKMKIKELIADLEQRQAQDDAVIKLRGEEVELDEGKMKELHGYIQQGMSAREIAKKMKLDVKTIQALMPKKEEVELDEGMRVFRVSSSKLQGNVHAKDEKEAEKIFRKKGAKGEITITDRGPARRQPRLVNNFELDEKSASKSATGYDIYHKDFSSALQHAYKFAKSKGQPIKSNEIDNKVATGPRKPSKGKENSYTLETEKGKMWSVQVYNMGNTHELNMYLTSSYVPEEVELDEAVKEYDVKIKVGSKTNSYNIMAKDELSAAQSVLHSVMARSRTGGSLGLDAVRKRFPDMKSLKKKGISVSIKEEVELDDIKEETNSLVEASAAQAARDARRAMRSDPDMRSKGDTADVAATDKDVESAAKNIVMQLRKSVSMNGQKNVEFASGTQKVPASIAQKVLDMYMKQRTSSDKGAFQTKIAKSYKDLLNAIKGK